LYYRCGKEVILMNYTEVVKRIAEETKVSQADVKKVLESLGSVISQSLAESDERVRVGHLGSFYKHEVKERTYTGGVCVGKTSPAHYRIKFEPCKDMKDALPAIKKKKSKKK
jgi:nucleoid DNA-binding protein